MFCREVGFDTKLEVVIPEFIRLKPPDHLSRAETTAWLKERAAPTSLSVYEKRKWEHAIMDIVAIPQ